LERAFRTCELAGFGAKANHLVGKETRREFKKQQGIGSK
jgi:hypothetical protein